MVLDLTTVQNQINHWITNFVEIPHAALGNFPPCPYARSARLANTVDVRLGSTVPTDLDNLARHGLAHWEVIVWAYDPDHFEPAQLSAWVEQANRDVLNQQDIIVLEDHPSDPEVVNGVTMNQGTYALLLAQSLSDLDRRAKILAARGFYHNWPESYLQGLFRHRRDPRT